MYKTFWLYVYNTPKLNIEYSFAFNYKASFLFSTLGFWCILKGGGVYSNVEFDILYVQWYLYFTV